MNDKFVIWSVVLTVEAVVVAVVFVLLYGLFVKDVDNAEIFKIIGPSFTTVVGALVAIVSYGLGKKSGESEGP